MSVEALSEYVKWVRTREVWHHHPLYVTVRTYLLTYINIVFTELYINIRENKFLYQKINISVGWNRAALIKNSIMQSQLRFARELLL